MAGGYQTLTLKGHDSELNSTSQTVEGIWDIYKVQFTSKTITIGG